MWGGSSTHPVMGQPTHLPPALPHPTQHSLLLRVPLHRHITPGGILSACACGSPKMLGAQTISIIRMRPSPTPHHPAPQPACWQQPLVLVKHQHGRQTPSLQHRYWQQVALARWHPECGVWRHQGLGVTDAPLMPGEVQDTQPRCSHSALRPGVAVLLPCTT